MSNWIIVSNLPSDYTSHGLRNLFEHNGIIQAAYIKINELKSAADGYVQFVLAKDAKHTASRYHKMYICGREIAVYLLYSSLDTLSSIKVSNIPRNSSRTSLLNLFIVYGDIIDIKLNKTDANPTALIAYSNVNDAISAQKEMNGSMIANDGVLSVSLIDNDARNLKYRHNITLKRMPIHQLRKIISSERTENNGGYAQQRKEHKIYNGLKNNQRMSYGQHRQYKDHTYTHSHRKPQQQQQQQSMCSTNGVSSVPITCNVYHQSHGVYRSHYVVPAPTTTNNNHSVRSRLNSGQQIQPMAVPQNYLYSNIINQNILDLNRMNAQVHTIRARIDALLAGTGQQREIQNQHNTMHGLSTQTQSHSVSQSQSQSNTLNSMNISNGSGARMNCFGAQYGGNRQ